MFTGMQKTISKPVKIQGIGLHAGLKVNVVLKPSLPNTGIIYKRIDIKDNDKNSIKASFFSQNTERHQLVLSFGKIQSCSNEYIDHKPDQLYIDYEEALIIKQLLTQDSIDKSIQEFEKQKSIEDDFK